MKRNNIFNLIVLVAVAATMVSCEGFFNRYPHNKPSAEIFLSNENELRIYSNGLTNSAILGTSIAIGNNAYTDLCATKLSSDKYHPGIWNASKGGGWSSSNWSFMRQVNYMIENMYKSENNVSKEVYGHYMGVARFWRANSHMRKLKTFGNIPWIDKYLQPNDPKLYAGREDREYVFHMILQDLQFAAENCLDTPEFMDAARINVNKYVALAFIARACLYEGTYRKYHDRNPSTNIPWNNQYETSDELLEIAAQAARHIMESGEFRLHTGDVKKAYSDLFISNTIQNDEVIWGRSYSEELRVSHDITGEYNSSTWGQQYSPVKEFVRMYLNLDGTCVTDDKVNINKEFEGRDWRLHQTVNSPGHTYESFANGEVLKPTNFTHVFTGYSWIKWNQEKEDNYRAGALCYNALPIFRYGEILLIYAEAMEELGQMTENIWNDTVGALRQRAGVTSIYPGSAAYVRDAWLSDYYTDPADKSQTALSDVNLEIRRERAIELAMESDSRHDDLMRWKMGWLIERRYNSQGWRGIYVTESEALYGFDFNGKRYTLTRTSAHTDVSYPISNTGADSSFSLSEGTYGYLIYNYRLEWDDCMYLDPIPESALNVNPNLGQNYGWDKR